MRDGVSSEFLTRLPCGVSSREQEVDERAFVTKSELEQWRLNKNAPRQVERIASSSFDLGFVFLLNDYSTFWSGVVTSRKHSLKLK